MLKLSCDNPLSRYPVANEHIRLEYQVGQTLVWVHFPNWMEDAEAISIADDIVKPAWDDLPQALILAEGFSRAEIPDFWHVHDASDVRGERLQVWSVQINVETRSAEYHVSENHGFFARLLPVPGERPPPALPELPDRHMLKVTRTANGTLTACA
nr:hypothetical protein [uncultured Sphingomonas sp.]